jgi:FG-GAP-like repeat
MTIRRKAILLQRRSFHVNAETVMVKSRLAVTLLALVLSCAALPFVGLAADVCQNPTFRFAQGSPFKLQPKPGVYAQPTALAAGTYIARPGVQTGCGCDLAVGLKSQSIPSQGFVAGLRGNDDGTFTGSADALRQVDGIPVAIATGRFRTDAPVDGIVVVTSPASGQGNGQVQVFVPDANGAYPQSPTAAFHAGPNPAAITTGDFNGDGMLDVAVINKDNSSLTILLGDGRGTFANPLTVANLAGTPESLTAGRFSGSSNADDIAIGVVQFVDGATQVGIVIVRGSTSGQFSAKPIIPVGQRGSLHPWVAAANLSGPSVGAAGRRWRDLAIAFTDRTSSGDGVGRVKVLLGRDGGEFGDVAAAPTLDIGATFPTSIKVVDLDDDGVVDLVVSAFGQSTSLTDGTIHFFKGQAAPDANVGFRPNKRWFTIPATANIRPRALVAARFGNHRPDQPLASMGIAAINAPDLNSLAVFQGNGRGSFVQPSLVTTLVGEDDHLFVAGDFHSSDGSSPLQDLAFITKEAGQNVVRVLQANGAGGFAPPDPGQPSLLAGNSPSLMVAGQFVAGGPTALAIVDDTGGIGQQPVLKIFFGQGNGLLTAGPELALNNTGRPRAMTVVRFRGTGMPLDIALVGDTTVPGSSSFSGKLTLLLNDGQGGFTVGTSQVLSFAPSSVATSSRLSPVGKADLLIRDANANRFQFLINIGNGGFRLPIGPNLGFFDGAGDFDALLVGNVAHGGANPPDDVITFDRDMTLRIFVNNGRESFTLRTIAPGGDPHFAGAQPPYLLADFGSSTLALAAPVSRAGQISLLLLQGDGAGGFTPATGEVPLEPVRGVSTTTFTTTVSQMTETPVAFSNNHIGVRQTLVAQFRSNLHGNGKPDFAFVTKATESARTVGNCPGDTRSLPAPAPLRHVRVCPKKTEDPDTDCPPPQRPCPPIVTFTGPCCRCNDRDVPVLNRCPNKCEFPEPITPFRAFCDQASTFTPALTVFGNTCGD